MLALSDLRVKLVLCFGMVNEQILITVCSSASIKAAPFSAKNW